MISRPLFGASGAAWCARNVLLATALLLLLNGCSTTPERVAPTLETPPTVSGASAAAEAQRPTPKPSPAVQKPEPKPATPAAAPPPPTQPTEPVSSESPAKDQSPEADKDSLLYKILHPVETLTGKRKPKKPEPGLAGPGGDLWAEYRKRSVLPSCRGIPQAERFAREYASMQGFMDRTMVRAEPFLYFILAQAKAEGVPSDLVLLPIIESQFDPELTSSQGAAGMWQFMAPTGRLMGLKINEEYDGRLDAFAATQAAMRYFRRLAERFDGDYVLAMTAYNVGDGRLLREMRGTFPPYGPTFMFGLNLPAETKNHIAKWIGLSCLFKHPERYGFRIATVAFEPQLRKVDLGERADLAKVAALSGLDADWLKHLNPGYRRAQTPGSGPHYFLLPVRNANRLDDALARMGPAERSLLAANADPLPAPSDAVPVSGLRDPVIRARAGMAPAASGRTHTVKSGESAWTIARSNSVRLADLLAVNGLSSRSTLRAGQSLKLPSGARVAATPSSTSNREAAPAAYKVRSGDSLWTIARRFGLSLDELLKLNGLNRNARLKPGMSLKTQP
jgi:membrane-bound lytic murein transglycosylase D